MDAIEQLKQDVREGRVGVDRLIDVIVTQQRQREAALQELKAARQRIEELEKKVGGSGTAKVDEPFSMRAEEKRQPARHKKKKHKLLGIVLVFDEIVTGFRLAWGGAQERYGVAADLACYGKVIGGGYPLSVVVG